MLAKNYNDYFYFFRIFVSELKKIIAFIYWIATYIRGFLSHYVFAWIWYQYIYLIWIVLLFRMWNSISFDLLHLDNLEHCWNSILIFSHWILSIVSMYTEKLYIYWVEIFFFNSGLKMFFTRDFYDLEIIFFINIIQDLFNFFTLSPFKHHNILSFSNNIIWLKTYTRQHEIFFFCTDFL